MVSSEDSGFFCGSFCAGCAILPEEPERETSVGAGGLYVGRTVTKGFTGSGAFCGWANVVFSRDGCGSGVAKAWLGAAKEGVVPPP